MFLQAFFRSIQWLFLLVVASLSACQGGATENGLHNESGLWTIDHLISSLQDEAADVMLIEVGTTTAYESGHLPGAYNLGRSDFTNVEDYPFGGMRIEAADLADLLGSLGVDSTTSIILYDDYANVDAARLYWLLRNYGHQSTALLDGGKVAWELAGHELSIESPLNRAATDYQFSEPINFLQLADLNVVLSALENEEVVVVDTREPEEFLGAPYLQNGKLYRYKRGAYTNGCIPGAIHLNWTETVELAGDHRFLPLEDLREKLASHGITSDKKIITYCQSGVRSAHFTFVLTELLRFPSVFNYDGSWIEWSYHHMNGQKVPIEQHTDSLSCEQRWQELAATLEANNAL